MIIARLLIPTLENNFYCFSKSLQDDWTYYLKLHYLNLISNFVYFCTTAKVSVLFNRCYISCWIQSCFPVTGEYKVDFLYECFFISMCYSTDFRVKRSPLFNFSSIVNLRASDCKWREIRVIFFIKTEWAVFIKQDWLLGICL